MSSQGKLYTDIEKLFAIPTEGISKDDREAMTALYNTIKTPLLNILDDARKYYPVFCPYLEPTVTLMDILREHEKWFKNWFGKSSADNVQVSGGCAGHIDLNKLQDIEKQE